jgi:peroxiredoxin
MKHIIRLVVLWSLATAALAEQTLTPIPGNRVAPEFSLQDTRGKLHRLSDYRGKPVIINFWATWCPPCREELPSMNRAWHKIKEEGIAMLAINMGEDEDTIFIFSADYPTDFTVLMDQSGEVIEQWPVRGLPTTFVIAPDGTIAYRAIGSREWDARELLDSVRALKESPSH